ncbi:defensin, beta-like 1 [Fundulus heteroclitus]|uniref:defensin, beta-like 1 n=1 Tax=Fundulus heteroclitus TaxID=8078 RepID=UPI00165C07DA|nr:defensin, beta-like 1 [Fundulus heteroclitus]
MHGYKNPVTGLLLHINFTPPSRLKLHTDPNQTIVSGATLSGTDMFSYRIAAFFLLLLLLLQVVENEAASFPWSCPSLSGVCRKVCLPTEMFFGPLGCGKGFLCCVSHFL